MAYQDPQATTGKRVREGNLVTRVLQDLLDLKAPEEKEG